MFGRSGAFKFGDLETIGLAEDWADEDLAGLASFEQEAQRR